MEKPDKLGKYEIRQELGRGAMGVVYEAFDPLIERTVAIKVILKSSIDKSEVDEAFGRFRREARAAGRLSHPKIVSIYEYGEDDDMAFIVMELIRGKELKEHFEHHETFGIDEGIRIVLQILDALEYSHARGVVHRDIKPANILITHDGKIKIADFGIAKVESSLLTQVGAIMGTPTYMPPEQFAGLEVDNRADLYSTGVILYQFLTGQRPFVGGIISIMHQVTTQEATPPSSLNPAVSKELEAVVKKAMAKRPEDRYQSAAEFMQALKAAAQSQPAAARPAAGRTSPAGDAERTIRTSTAALDIDQPLIEPASPKTAEARRQRDIEFWQRITDSRDANDFRRYLDEFPEGEFAPLAQRRIDTLEKAAEQARRDQAEKIRLVLAEKKRIEAERQAAAERAKAEVAAEARRKQEAAEKAVWAQQIAEIKKEAEITRAAEEARRRQEAAEKERRAQELSASLSQRTHQFVEVLSKREAVVDAERKLKMEHKKKLKEEVERKALARQKIQARKAALHAEEPDDDEEMGAAEVAAQPAPASPAETDLAKRERELAEARARAEALERRSREAEALAAQARKRTRLLAIAIGAIVSLLLIGALVMLAVSK